MLSRSLNRRKTDGPAGGVAVRLGWGAGCGWGRGAAGVPVAAMAGLEAAG